MLLQEPKKNLLEIHAISEVSLGSFILRHAIVGSHYHFLILPDRIHHPLSSIGEISLKQCQCRVREEAVLVYG